MSKKGKKKPPRFTGEDQKTSPDSRVGPKRPYRHDSFELDIDVDTDMTVIQEPGQEEPETTQATETTERSELLMDEMKTEASADFELPKTSEEEVLPFFMPSRTTTPSPADVPAGSDVPPPPSFDLSEEESEPDLGMSEDVLSLFDASEDISASSEVPPIHIRPDVAPPAPSEPITFDSQTGAPAPSTPGSDPRGDIGAGDFAGVEPLDISDFESRPLHRRKKATRKVEARMSGPPPMARSSKVVRRRFQVSLRDVALLMLVLVLAAAVYVAWIIYKDYRDRQELDQVDKGREVIEREMDESIEKTKSKVEKDIP